MFYLLVDVLFNITPLLSRRASELFVQACLHGQREAQSVSNALIGEPLGETFQGVRGYSTAAIGSSGSFGRAYHEGSQRFWGQVSAI